MSAAPALNQWEQAEAEAQRWVDAAQRAVDEGVRVVQVEPCGSWVATSGTVPGKAYRLEVSNGVCHGCACSGHDFGKVCKHRAAFYIVAGQLAAPELTLPKPPRERRPQPPRKPRPQLRAVSGPGAAYRVRSERRPDPLPTGWRGMYEVVQTDGSALSQAEVFSSDLPVVTRCWRWGEADQIARDLNAGRVAIEQL